MSWLHHPSGKVAIWVPEPVADLEEKPVEKKEKKSTSRKK